MKRINLCGLLICSAAMLLNSSCTEETLATGSPTYIAPPTNTLPTTQNIKLNVFAGEDTQVILSSDSRFLILSGYYFARGIQGEIINLNNVKIQWEKKSGPSSYKLEYPNSIKTKVSDLEKGIYEFELTVTNDNGLTVKDTVRFTVGSISENPKEIIFENKIWWPIWYFNIEINDFNLLIPQNNFKVYIQRDNNPQWEEVKHYSENLTSKYDYFIETRPEGAAMYDYGSLYISYYGSDTNDTPSVKIVF
jgi:hypothetical protein